MKFGEYCKQKRIENHITLREFCKKVKYDCGNYSKIERGIMKPPKNEMTLLKWADVLKLPDESRFFEMAQVARNEIPINIRRNEQLMDILPAFPFTKKPTKKQIDELIEKIKSTFNV